MYISISMYIDRYIYMYLDNIYIIYNAIYYVDKGEAGIH